MRIGLLGPVRFPLREPWAGGLEATTATLAGALAARGHDVVLFAAAGSRLPAPVTNVEIVAAPTVSLSRAARRDISMPPQAWIRDHHAYLGLMLDLAQGRFDLDVVHDSSLHHLPIAMARTLDTPMVVSLHTPPTPWLESAVALGPVPATFAAVSAHTARAWSHALCATVVRNGVDTDRWSRGPGGDGAVWSGRLVPEKGVDLAIRAARRAGMRLCIAGPLHDREWFDARVRPLLGDDIEYVGHLATEELSALVGSARVALVTPRWDEPYGLVVAEALACGTPVAGIARGALPELLDETTGRLADPRNGAGGLAAALLAAAELERAACRRRAEQVCSLDRMLDDYERLYRGDRASVPADATVTSSVAV